MRHSRPRPPWPKAKNDFANARATSFYRYQLPAFTDLYGVDFETLTDEQARDLNRRIFAHYQSEDWTYEVVTERANIELMFNDPYWDRLTRTNYYPFAVPVLKVTRLLRGFHPSEFPGDVDSPFRYAREEKLPTATLDDYLAVIERWLKAGRTDGAVCLKTTTAYDRTLEFGRVPKERAARVYGRSMAQLSDAEVKEFEDFIMWHITELSARLEVMPSNRLMWGADAHHAEGTYAATEVTRRCLAEALAEKVERGELREDDALRIGRQVLRENALELFPRLKDRLWKHKGKLQPPAK